MKNSHLCTNTIVLTLLICALSSAWANSDPEACKGWKKSFDQVAAEAKSERSKLAKYMPKGKNLKNLPEWKANVDDATFRKIFPIVNRLSELNDRGKRLFKLMHDGRCKV